MVFYFFDNTIIRISNQSDVDHKSLLLLVYYK